CRQAQGVPTRREGVMRIRLCLAVTVCVMATSGLALAQAPAGAKDEARQHFDRAVDLFQRQALDEALAEFQRSLELFPTKAALTNAALCLQRLGRLDEALTLLQTLPKQFGPLPPDEQADLDAALAELAAQVGSVDLRGLEPGAQVIVDGRLRGTTPL